MSTETIKQSATHFQRVVEELCELVGFRHPDVLLKGGKLRIDDCRISFLEASDSLDQILVYVDMGMLSAAKKEDAYKTLLKINFSLLAGTRGVIGIHPETEHIFYSFPYTVDEAASGRNLLDLLIRFIGDVGITALLLPKDVRESKGAAAAAGRQRASRIIEGKKNKPAKD